MRGWGGDWAGRAVPACSVSSTRKSRSVWSSSDSPAQMPSTNIWRPRPGGRPRARGGGGGGGGGGVGGGGGGWHGEVVEVRGRGRSDRGAGIRVARVRPLFDRPDQVLALDPEP